MRLKVLISNRVFLGVIYFIFRKDCFKIEASLTFLKDHELNDLVVVVKIYEIQ